MTEITTMGEIITMGGNNNSGNSLLVSEIISTDAEDPDYVYTDRFFYNDGDGLDGNKITSSTSEYSYSDGQSYLQTHQILFTQIIGLPELTHLMVQVIIWPDKLSSNMIVRVD